MSRQFGIRRETSLSLFKNKDRYCDKDGWQRIGHSCNVVRAVNCWSDETPAQSTSQWQTVQGSDWIIIWGNKGLFRRNGKWSFNQQEKWCKSSYKRQLTFPFLHPHQNSQTGESGKTDSLVMSIPHWGSFCCGKLWWWWVRYVVHSNIIMTFSTNSTIPFLFNCVASLVSFFYSFPFSLSWQFDKRREMSFNLFKINNGYCDKEGRQRIGLSDNVARAVYCWSDETSANQHDYEKLPGNPTELFFGEINTF